MKLTLTSLCIALALFPLHKAHASAPATLLDMPLESLMDMQVTTASRFAQKASQAPSAVSIVTAEDIRTHGWQSLAEILGSLRGLYLSDDHNYTYVGVRGFSPPGDYNNRILLLINGHRVNDSVYDQALVAHEFQIDTALIERVEFVPGPGSALYGSNALFGVINVITRQGADLQGYELAGGLGSHGERQRRATLGHKQEDGTDLLMSISQVRGDGQDWTFPGSGTASGVDGEQSDRFFASLEKGAWNLNVSYVNRKKQVPTGAYGTDFNDPANATTDGMGFVDLQYRAAANEKLEWSARLYYDQSWFTGTYVYSGVHNRDEAEGARWGGEWQAVSTQFDRHHLVFGLSYREDFTQDQRNFDVAPYASYLDSAHSARKYGLYLQDEWALTSALTASLGVRQDHHSRAGDFLSPRLALLWQAGENTMLKAIYGTAYRAPNVYEMYYTTADALPNPDLQPEEITTYELIAEHLDPRGIRLSAGLFQYRICDLITQKSEAGMLIFRNEPHAQANGLDLEAERLWSNGRRARVSYTLENTEDGSGNRLVNAPRHLFKALFSTPLFDTRLRLGTELLAFSQRRSLSGGHTAGFGIVNMNLAAERLLPGLEISLAIRNLLDKPYAVPAGSEQSVDALPQTGRSLRLNLAYRF